MTPLSSLSLVSATSRHRLFATTLVGVALCGAITTLTMPEAHANPGMTRSMPALFGETMRDRCSGDVAFTTTYSGKVTDQGTITLDRPKSGWTAWTDSFTVKTSNSGHIRWFCRSKSYWGWVDPGTWPINGLSHKGWIPERSRCNNKSNRIRARLGPDRRLQIKCM